MFNSNRASANSIINRVMSNANGIGQSKVISKTNSNILGENGQKVSDKAHSIKDMQNLRTITTQYINYIKANYEGKVANNINSDSAKSFLEAKAQEVKGSTLNTYISTLSKVTDNLAKDNIGTLNREQIKEIKQELKYNYNLSKEHNNRAYSNVEAIKEEMKHSTMYLSTQLQAEAGLRASDAINSDKWTINNDNTMTISGSKSGLTYTTAPLNNNLVQSVQEAIKNGYKANYEEYRVELKEAVANTNQNYTGTHGLRYSFAQERVEELLNQGYTKDEADGQTSLEMGHSRLDITNHYTQFNS